jgi:tyrosyl-tRNA synthetase
MSSMSRGFPAKLLTAFKLTPQLLKPAVTKALHDILIPIQEAYNASKEWQEITLLAYPPPEKKQKKVKKIGTRYPGGQDKATADNNAEELAKLKLETEKPEAT